MSTQLRPALDIRKDIGSASRRWGVLYFGQFISGWNYLTVSDFISKEQDLFVDPDGETNFITVRYGKYAGVQVTGELPPAGEYGQLMGVVEGAWGPLTPSYQLPAARNTGDWLTVNEGVWMSWDVYLESPPEVSEIDEGYILAVLDGRWGKYDGDNFYLPDTFLITPEVPHAVTVSGYRWLKRPLAPVTAHRDGLMPTVPDDPSVTFRGDGSWNDGTGDDRGRWRVGDIRNAAKTGAGGWLPCDGKTVGQTGELSSHLFAEIFYFLLPGGDWNTDTVALPNLPGQEIMFSDPAYHPTDVQILAGPAEAAPYTIRLRDRPNGIVEYERTSPGMEWYERDGIMFLDVGGRTIEDYSGFALTDVPPSAVIQGFYLVEIEDKDGNVRMDSISITEEDVMRMDTAVVSDNLPSGHAPRAAGYRYQLAMLNGRPIHSPFYSEEKGLDGTKMSPIDKNHPNLLQGATVFTYGFGDHVPYNIYSHDQDVSKLLNQLKEMDSPNDIRPAPKFHMQDIPFDLPRGAFWGGVSGADGKMYFVPHNSTFILIWDPKLRRAYRWGNFANRRFKWAGAVQTFDNRIICFPYNEAVFLEINLTSRTYQLTDYGLGSALEEVKFCGGTLLPNNRVSALGAVGYYELDLDLSTDRGYIYDLSISMTRRIKAFAGTASLLKEEHPVSFYRGQTHTLSRGGHPDTMNRGYDRIQMPFMQDKSLWGGTMLTAHGVAAGVPCGHWTPEMQCFGRPRDPDHAYDMSVPANQKLFYWSLYGKELGEAGYEFGGGIPGDTAAAISEAYRFSNYDRLETRYNIPQHYDRVSGQNARRSLSLDRTKYLGGVLAANGCNYLIPCGGYHPTVMVIGTRFEDETSFPRSSFRIPDPRYLNCRGGALGPDGYIYSAAADGSCFFALNPRTRRLITVDTGLYAYPDMYTAWMGVVAGPDGWMYYPPFDSSRMLIADPCVPCGEWPAELSRYINKF